MAATDPFQVVFVGEVGQLEPVVLSRDSPHDGFSKHDLKNQQIRGWSGWSVLEEQRISITQQDLVAASFCPTFPQKHQPKNE